MSITWSSPSATVAKGVIAIGGGDGTPFNPTDGIDLAAISGGGVFARFDSDPRGGTLRAFIFNLADSAWYRAPELDLTIAGGLLTQTWRGFGVAGRAGRLAYAVSPLTPVTGTLWIVGSV